MKKRFLHIVLTPFTHESRILRELSAVYTPEREFLVYCMHKDQLPMYEQTETHTTRRFSFFIKRGTKNFAIKLMLFFECFVRMICEGLKYKPDFIHAHDLNGLPIGFVLSRLTGAKLLYDSHEFWSDPVHKGKVPPFIYKILLRMEKVLASRADGVITVSGSIAKELHKNLDLAEEPVLIRNMPASIKKNVPLRLREDLGISKDKTLILYQGGITKARGLFLLLKAFEKVQDPNTVAVFMGDGVAVDELKEKISKHPCKDRIFYMPAVQPNVLLAYTADADIGVHPMVGGLLNHEYALPNKLFEYIQAGVAVLVSDMTEMKTLVDKYELGRTFARDNINALAEELLRLIADKSAIERYSANAKIAAKELNWDHEKLKLVALYDKILVS